MKTKFVLSLTLGILMALALCAPAFASPPPERGTFAYGSIEFTTDPGESFQTGNILHIRDGVGVLGGYELPWGTPSIATEYVFRTDVDMTTGIGSATSHTEEDYPNGVLLGTVHTSLNGAGFWTYPGPDFTYGGRTITTGETFFGLLMSGITVKHGVSGELKGLETREAWTAVLLLDFSGPTPVPAGVNYGYATGSYIWLK